MNNWYNRIKIKLSTQNFHQIPTNIPTVKGTLSNVSITNTNGTQYYRTQTMLKFFLRSYMNLPKKE